MNRATGPVAPQGGQTKAFRNNALTRKGRIAVQKQRKNGRPVNFGCLDERGHPWLQADPAWRGTCQEQPGSRSQGETGWQSGTSERHFRQKTGQTKRPGGTSRHRSFHIVRRVRTAFEFVEHSAVRLAHHLGQHVQTTAVSHAKDDILKAI